MTLQKFLYTASWAFLFIFLVPTGLILASWNAVPGDQLYDVKVGLERTLLFFASPSYAAQGSLQIQYTKRRAKEVEKVATTTYAREGLSNLTTQVNDATQTIQKVNNQVTKAELAQSYIKTLRETQQVLEQQKQQVSQIASNNTYGFRAGSQTTSRPTTVSPVTTIPSQPGTVTQPPAQTQPQTQPATSPVTQPTTTEPVTTQPVTTQPVASSQPTTPVQSTTPSPDDGVTPIDEPTPEEIEEEIEETQEEIEEQIEELEKIFTAVNHGQQGEAQREENARNDEARDKQDNNGHGNDDDDD